VVVDLLRGYEQVLQIVVLAKTSGGTNVSFSALVVTRQKARSVWAKLKRRRRYQKAMKNH
jgi:hypothetical protein